MPDAAPSILVVDDDFPTRLLASEALLAEGFATLEAENGVEALQHIDVGAPTAILLDINMPELDGYEVCRRIRQRPGGDAISIMVMTANDDIDAVSRAFAAGATDFITKPLNLPLLAHRIRYMLRAADIATAARDIASRLARAQRLARLVHWQLGIDGRFRWTSDPFEVFWPDAAERPTDDHLLIYVHPDDRDRVAEALSARTAHQIDFRLQFPDGSERVVHQDAELETTDRGSVLIGATQDITEMKRAEQQIAQLAFYDDLTGIPNRPFVERFLRRADPAVARSAIAVQFGLGRLDRLSTETCETLVRAATARVIERVRGADLDIRLDQAPRAIEAYTSATLVARTAPDELLVVTSDLTSGTGAGIALHLASALAAPYKIAGRDIAMHARFGAVDYPDPVGDLRRLAEQARTAMLDAERVPPRNIAVWTSASGEQRARRAELGYQLAVALDAVSSGPHPDLTIAYAPRIEPMTRCVVGVRAEPRWLPAIRDPQALAAILARDPALRERLAGWTLAQAILTAGRWLAAGTALSVAVELTHGQLGTHAFAASLEQKLADAKLTPELLELEITDMPEDDELAALAAVLTDVRAVGVRIALARIDDRCSLGELRRLPLDTLRIDHSTIERLGPEFVATVSKVARALELRFAATGIDSPAALAAIDPHEPDELSGLLLGPAVPGTGVPGLCAPDAIAPNRTLHAPLGARSQ